MKTAIIHDAFLHIGGAEKVFLELVDLYPEADIYIPIINKNLLYLIEKKTKGNIYSSFLSKLSFFYRYASIFKPLLIFYWENLNLKKYKIIITSSHSFNSKLVNTTKETTHISYVYTPPRYLSKHFNEIRFLKNSLIRILLFPLLRWLKKKDYQSGQKPTLIISISKTIQNRIWNTYNRKSLVIYPPVNLSQLITKKGKGKYYLCFSRLAKQKGISLAVKTCTKLQLPLIVVGTGSELGNLKKIAGPTIVFKGFIKDEELEEIFINTKAMINCAIEEDFGMVTIEAASRGIPTIGYNSGGLKETIIKNKTGIFFDEHTVESLSEALIKFEKKSFDSKDCYNFSRKFSTKIFRMKMKKLIEYYK